MIISFKEFEKVLESSVATKESLNDKHLPEINKAVLKILKHYNLAKHFEVFKSNVELFPLIANLINYTAKAEDYDWYQYKPLLLRYIAKYHSKTWSKEGIMYCETPYGQISFHVFNDEEKLINVEKRGIRNDSRKWTGVHPQKYALDLVNSAIEDADEDNVEGDLVLQPKYDYYEDEEVEDDKLIYNVGKLPFERIKTFKGLLGEKQIMKEKTIKNFTTFVNEAKVELTEDDFNELFNTWNEFGEKAAVFAYLKKKQIEIDRSGSNGGLRFYGGYVVRYGFHEEVSDITYYYFREDLYRYGVKKGFVFNEKPDYSTYPEPKTDDSVTYLNFTR